MSEYILQLNEQVIHNELKDLVKNTIEETLNAMLDAEADRLVNAERYARDEDRQGYRAGHYDRSFVTSSGEVNLRMPKLKGIPSETSIIERYKRRETSVEEALIEMDSGRGVSSPRRRHLRGFVGHKSVTRHHKQS